MNRNRKERKSNVCDVKFAPPPPPPPSFFLSFLFLSFFSSSLPFLSFSLPRAYLPPSRLQFSFFFCCRSQRQNEQKPKREELCFLTYFTSFSLFFLSFSLSSLPSSLLRRSRSAPPTHPTPSGQSPPAEAGSPGPRFSLQDPRARLPSSKGCANGVAPVFRQREAFPKGLLAFSTLMLMGLRLRTETERVAKGPFSLFLRQSWLVFFSTREKKERRRRSERRKETITVTRKSPPCCAVMQYLPPTLFFLFFLLRLQ